MFPRRVYEIRIPKHIHIRNNRCRRNANTVNIDAGAVVLSHTDKLADARREIARHASGTTIFPHNTCSTERQRRVLPPGIPDRPES